MAESMALARPAPHVELTHTYTEAGFDHVYFHQVGRDQEGFFRFWERELAPAPGAEVAAPA